MSKIFFDTNLFIYIFEGLDPYRSRMIALRKRILERGDKVVTSALTLGELLVKPTRMGETSLIQQYDHAIRTTAQVVNFDSQIASRYATLRAAHNIRSADAMQLACAAHVGVDLFITSNKGLHALNLPGIGFIASLEKVPL